MSESTTASDSQEQVHNPEAYEAAPEQGEGTPEPRLIVEATGVEFPLAGEATTIGSGEDNDIVLDDPGVAGHQATIYARQGAYVLEVQPEAGGGASDATVGTFVNEQLVEGSVTLQDGDVIRVGNTIMAFRTKAAAAAEPEPLPIVEEPPSRPFNRPLLIGIGVAAIAGIALLCLLAAILILSRGDQDEAQVTPPPAATATPLPTDVVPPPQVEYFQANPSSVQAGSCTTLQWGAASGAEEVRIEPDVGGVGTPDSVEVCPPETTEYVLTAEGPGGATTVSAVVEVVASFADLTIDAIDFDPNPPTEGNEAQVSITIRNAGMASADGFDWQWQAGRDADFDGRVDGLGAGETTVVGVAWTPGAPYESLTTEAQVDTADEIEEEDEDNNRLEVEVRVIPAPSQPQMAEFQSERALDGFRTNDGRGSTSDDILVGNGEIIRPGGEVVARGFLSFDLSDLPPGARIERAELRFYQLEVTGDPYGKLGNLVLEHVSFGSRLDDAAFDTVAFDEAALADQQPAEEWYILNGDALVPWLQQDVDTGQSRFQLRLRFSDETDGDGEEDWISIQPGASFLGSSKAPLLIVTYVP